MTTSRPLQMPRRLAIRLLHEAQIATEPFSGLVVASDLPDAEPDGWLPMRPGENPLAIATPLHAQQRKAWALYFFRPSLPAAPVAGDFATMPALLRLTASLATKGVLQLRAWRHENGRVMECELHVHD